MEYINDINILDAVIHILDNNSDEPILNQYKLDLGDEVYKFIYRHVERALNDEELKYAVFNPERNIVKELSQEYLKGANNDLVGISQEIARQLFSIMKGNGNIPSCDLMVVTLSTDQGPILGILKLDYVKNFTHKIDFVEDKIGIGIVQQFGGLPASSQRIQKCAFIKPIMEGQEFNLMVIDKQKKNKDEEEYGTNYFINSLLGCTVVTNERDMTKAFIKATEAWTRNNVVQDADKAEKIRTSIKAKLKEEESINVQELSSELFKEEPEAKRAFDDYIASQGLNEEVQVDKQYVEKKLKRVRLKIDKEIDLYIDEEAYHDTSKFEIIRNGDGSINLVIKHVMNYIEK
ncbi:nucleoid-associated protein [Clostridium sp. 'White wine YQ']|uniref:nucleoid-associated protein n=1 Tax=Clostridium sp. 'White wine YQ' TaxID=3027474 RepID=UPI0023670613|nr:nucleoid-associated protein [Clostridium sp. 'White wine YQ']MDD7794930.1 nucleoid-associated protein [Clostridium sp. 'White wine YQ']